MPLVTALVLGLTTAVAPPVAASATAAPRPTVTPAAAPPTGVQARPDEVSARIAARSLRHRVEVTWLDTETSTTWVNPDGSLTSDYSTVPVRMRDASGGWVPIVTTLPAPALDGSVDVEQHPLRPRFAKFADATGALRLSPSGHQVTMQLRGARHDQIAAAGSTARYGQALPGTQLTTRCSPVR